MPGPFHLPFFAHPQIDVSLKHYLVTLVRTARNGEHDPVISFNLHRPEARAARGKEEVMGKPHAIIIGAGFTGCATAHDLALRGFDVTVVERGDIASGTSGRTHGLLHSGARYCVNDRESAVECIDENLVLRRIARQCIEANGGLFVALDESDLAYKPRFVEGALACGIPVEELTPQQALRMEPGLNPRLLSAVWVPDGTFEAQRLALAFAATAKTNGALFMLYTEVVALLVNGQATVTGVRVRDRTSGEEKIVSGDVVINAAGPWVGEIAAFAGLDVPVRPTPGVMVALNRRLSHMVINRLNKPSDGDIVVPQRQMVALGTTSYDTESADHIDIPEEHVRMILERGAELLPRAAQAQVRGVYAVARPLIGRKGDSGREIARTFKCFDHREVDGIEGLVTITGGKATTCRAMAEQTANVVCAKLGLREPCVTREVPLVSYRRFFYESPIGRSAS